MIVVKCWKYYHRRSVMGDAFSIWKGVFLFGFIPLYLKRAEIVK